MTRAAFLLTLLVLPELICACGRSGQQPQAAAATGAAEKLCAALRGTGIALQCSASDRDNAVNVVIDTGDDEAARKTCDKLAGSVAKQAADFPDKIRLRIFSPYRSDKQLASCSLDGADTSSAY
jgi:hypothetical protein